MKAEFVLKPALPAFAAWQSAIILRHVHAQSGNVSSVLP